MYSIDWLLVNAAFSFNKAPWDVLSIFFSLRYTKVTTIMYNYSIILHFLKNEKKRRESCSAVAFGLNVLACLFILFIFNGGGMGGGGSHTMLYLSISSCYTSPVTCYHEARTFFSHLTSGKFACFHLFLPWCTRCLRTTRSPKAMSVYSVCWQCFFFEK